MPMLETRSLSKAYSRRHRETVGIRDVDLQVQRGEFVALVGPSGSGKTTLLLSLGGLIRPSSGTVYLDGVSVYDLSPSRRVELRRSLLGFLFQTFNLVPYLTALENVMIPLMIAGKDRGQQRAVAESILARLGLGDRLDHKPSELSVGQQQRVALARTLANNPSIILADEPTGNLDPETAQSVLGMLQDLNQEGMTVVMVTHDPRMAALAGRVIRLVEGRIVGEREAVAEGQGDLR